MPNKMRLSVLGINLVLVDPNTILHSGTKMFKAKSIPTEHKDLIHDVAYDYHGRRMATCSSDQYVKIWDLVDGEWKCTANVKTHTGSVWRVVWAHPEFGQVIATCSFDRTASILEELPGDGGQWIKRGMLVDSRTSVQDVKFSPRHLGLQLAICSSDGMVRIYEAPDIMNLNNWPLKDKFDCKQSCSCISWNPSRVHPPMIAVGSDDPNSSSGTKVMIYEYSDTTRTWVHVSDSSTVTDPVRDLAFAPNLGRSYHVLAVAAKDVSIFTLKPIASSRKDGTAQSGLLKIQQVASFDDHNSQVWRLSWNVTGTILASSGDDGCVRLWKANYLNNWKPIAVMKGDGSASQQSQDIKAGSSVGSNSSVGSTARWRVLGKRASISGTRITLLNSTLFPRYK